MRFGKKLGQGTCSKTRIHCYCIQCTAMLDKHWTPNMPPQQKPHCQPVTECTYWPVIGDLQHFYIFHESSSIDNFENIYQNFLDGIIGNMIALIELVNVAQ